MTQHKYHDPQGSYCEWNIERNVGLYCELSQELTCAICNRPIVIYSCPYRKDIRNSHKTHCLSREKSFCYYARMQFTHGNRVIRLKNGKMKYDSFTYTKQLCTFSVGFQKRHTCSPRCRLEWSYFNEHSRWCKKVKAIFNAPRELRGIFILLYNMEKMTDEAKKNLRREQDGTNKLRSTQCAI